MPSGAEQAALEGYFRRYASFPEGSAGQLLTANWTSHYCSQAELQSLLPQWRDAIGNSARPDRATAEAFIRAFLQAARQLRKTNNGPGPDIICGETITEQNTIFDYVNEHQAGGDQWLIHLSTEGKCLMNGEQQWLLGPGQLIILPPAYECGYQRAPGCPRWVHLWLRFSLCPEWLHWSTALRSPQQLQILTLQDQQQASVKHAFSDLFWLAETPGEMQEQQMRNRIEYLLLLANSSQASEKPLDKRIHHAMEFISCRLQEDWPVEALAQHCKLSSARLAALFKQQLGVSPMQWRDQLRMRKARQLLTTTNLAINQIDEQLGYADPLHFSRRFRQLIGLSPRQFRQRRKA